MTVVGTETYIYTHIHCWCVYTPVLGRHIIHKQVFTPLVKI